MATTFDYLIVGGGMVADAAARGIRERDKKASIGILSEDMDEPYARPALTKKLWTDPSFNWEKTTLHTARDTGADIHLETTVVSLDPSKHAVTTANGEKVGYGRLLIATGGHPKQIDLPDDDDRVIYFRSANDYRRLRDFADRHAHVGVVGGGYIGTELAAALAQNGATVTLIFPDDVLGGTVFPRELAEKFQKQFTDAGVVLRANSTVETGAAGADGITLTLNDGSTLEVDAVVSGLGIEPAIQIADTAGIDVDDGILVDEHLRTSAVDVFAAGDVASYPDAILGRRRVEHVDNAKEMGAVAGQIMAGSEAPYDHTPYYYSVVFDSSYEAVGTLDASLNVVEDWSVPLTTGVLYYLDGSETRGVLLWNVSGKRDAARKVLSNTEPTSRDELVGAIPVR
jgi:3-phenylpropionate/trans-cinnamate dioxygenase ferredoxin reductase component